MDVTIDPHVRVSVRIRPFSTKEIEANEDQGWQKAGNLVQQAGQTTGTRFDNVFDGTGTNEDVFVAVGKQGVEGVLSGYNSTIFMYGQTGSGKTWTMAGADTDPGIVPRSSHYLFDLIGTENTGRDFLVRASFVEIYNECIYDLCNKKAVLKPRMQNDKFILPNIKEVMVKDSKELSDVQKQGESTKSMGVSNLNEHSSRSHCIFTITVESAPAAPAAAAAGGDNDADKPIWLQPNPASGSRPSSSSGRKPSSSNVFFAATDEAARLVSAASATTDGAGVVRVASLHLVDLAGSESFSSTGGSKQQTGTRAINKSLSALKDVITALSKKAKFIPFRNSELTKMLKAALGGNSLTHMICTVNPSAGQVKESRFTVNFGNMASKVENVPVQNETSDDSAVLLKKYRSEISSLQSKLARLAVLDREKLELEEEVERLREMSGCVLDSVQVQENEARIRQLERELARKHKDNKDLSAALSEETKMRVQAQVRE